MTSGRKKNWKVGGGIASSVIASILIGYFKDEEVDVIKFVLTQIIAVLQNILEYLN